MKYKRLYFLLIPFIYAIFSLFFLDYAYLKIRESQSEIFYESCKEDISYIEMLTSLTTEDRIMLVSYADKRPTVFCALYDKDYNIISDRTVTLNRGLDPFQNGRDFLDNDHGEFEIIHDDLSRKIKYSVYYNHIDNTDETVILATSLDTSSKDLSAFVIYGVLLQYFLAIILQIYIISRTLKRVNRYFIHKKNGRNKT